MLEISDLSVGQLLTGQEVTVPEGFLVTREAILVKIVGHAGVVDCHFDQFIAVALWPQYFFLVRVGGSTKIMPVIFLSDACILGRSLINILI